MSHFPLLMSAALTFACVAPAFSQTKLVEKISQQSDEMVIPYEKYTLPNGLTVLIHEDHSDPIVHVDVTYHVGSAREEINKSGFAHFFEHMMFQGSENVADEAHFKIITEAGGTLNGTTNRDRTNYFETVPSNQLEKMLWLEADRMGFLLDAVTQEKFEVQRATVKNERGQRYDNQPYGLVSEFTGKHLYPYGHPYSWLTIGYVEDLNRVGVDDLKNFFLRWYGPNNAVLTVGGDVQPKEVLRLVEKYFGSIPVGPSVEPVQVPLPKLEQDRYVSMIDNYAKLPMLRMVFPTPPRFSKEEAALDCLAEILGQGKTSMFYQNFVKSGKAVSAHSYNYASELAGEFTVNITPYPGQQLSDIEALVRQTFNDFEKRGVTDEDIRKFKASMESDIVYGMESVAGKVSMLASFYTFTGNANYLTEYLQAYSALTKEDVLDAYRKYIKDQPALTVSVLTQSDPDNKAHTDNYTVDTKNYQAPDYGYQGLTTRKATDTFDRSIMPAAGAPVVVSAPEYWKADMDNKIRIIGSTTDEIPAVTLTLSFKGGYMNDPLNKAGLTDLFTTMLNEDTRNYTAEAFQQALDELGSRIAVHPSKDHILVQVRTLSKNLDATLHLLEERLLRPAFTQDDFDRNKKRAIEQLKNNLNRPTYVASVVFSKLLNGMESPLGQPSSGTEETLERITLDDIRQYYANRFTYNEAEIVAVGEIDKADMAKLNFLTQLPLHTVQLVALPEPPPVQGDRVYFVDVPGAAQTEFRIGAVTGVKYDVLGDYYKSTIMNYPLGGAFNSRLNLYLREEKGWTYGARSAFSGDLHTGYYTFSAGIKSAATEDALADVLQIVQQYTRGGMTDEELEFTRNSMSLSEARKYETGFQKAGFLSRILRYDLPEGFEKQQNEILQHIALSEVNGMAAKKIPDTSNLLIVLVGDKKELAEKIEARGFELIEVDFEGNLL